MKAGNENISKAKTDGVIVHLLDKRNIAEIDVSEISKLRMKKREVTPLHSYTLIALGCLFIGHNLLINALYL